jgi:hypothetical protein
VQDALKVFQDDDLVFKPGEVMTIFKWDILIVLLNSNVGI